MKPHVVAMHYLRGSFALAKTLWVRTETPLRAALLGHEICRKLLEEKARGEALGRQLRELMGPHRPAPMRKGASMR